MDSIFDFKPFVSITTEVLPGSQFCIAGSLASETVGSRFSNSRSQDVKLLCFPAHLVPEVMGGSIVFDGHRVASSWPVILGILESKAGLN